MIGTTDLEMFANMLESLRSFIGTTAERNTPVSSITCRTPTLKDHWRISRELPGIAAIDGGTMLICGDELAMKPRQIDAR